MSFYSHPPVVNCSNGQFIAGYSIHQQAWKTDINQILLIGL
jgi:hypothetical protein